VQARMRENESPLLPKPWRRRLPFLAGMLALALAAIFVPLWLSATRRVWIRHTQGPAHLPYELFGLTATLWLALLLIVRLRGRPLRQVAPFLLLTLVGLHYLSIIVAHTDLGWDFICYRDAAIAYGNGAANPYLDTIDQCYRYPPLLMQLLSLASRGVERLGSWALIDGSLWATVFYLYTCAQYVALLAALALSHRFSRIVGFPRLWGAGLVAVLFLFDEPLLRTLQFDQISLWLYVIMLAAILWASSRPLVAGILLAIGGHVKLVPLVLLPAWAAAGKWRIAAGSVLAFAAVFLAQTSAAADWRVWRQFIDFARVAFPDTPFRDNSLRGLAGSTGLLLVRITPLSPQIETQFQTAAFALLLLLLLAWFARRFWQRETAWRRQQLADNDRLLGHAMDGLALALLAAPATWEHMFLLTVPILIWAIAVHAANRWWQLVVIAVLILAIPTFDLYPLSYHRLVALLWLVWLIPPAACPQRDGHLSRLPRLP
jgi:hypothetical protein